MQTDSLQSPPPHRCPPYPQLKSEEEVGWRGSVDGEGEKTQWNYHCFNIQISFISLMLAQTKFIPLPRRQQAQGSWGRARAAWCLEPSCLPPPHPQALLADSLLSYHPPPTPSTTVTPSFAVTKGAWKEERKRERKHWWWRRNRNAGFSACFFWRAGRCWQRKFRQRVLGHGAQQQEHSQTRKSPPCRHFWEEQQGPCSQLPGVKRVNRQGRAEALWWLSLLHTTQKEWTGCNQTKPPSLPRE